MANLLGKKKKSSPSKETYALTGDGEVCVSRHGLRNKLRVYKKTEKTIGAPISSSNFERLKLEYQEKRRDNEFNKPFGEVLVEEVGL